MNTEVKEKVCSIKELHKAMMKCKKGVLWKDSVAKYYAHGLMRCYKLKVKLMDGSYKICKYINFTIFEPKKREIVSTRFPDRVFQRSLSVNYLTHEVQKDFIPNNFACQVGKGTHKAIQGFKHCIHNQWTKNGMKIWVLKCDIHDYFGSTSHLVAKNKTSYIRDEWARNELYRIIDSFTQGENHNVGMGLGSEITQSVQLAVLHPMDIGITKHFGIVDYIRYMDDFYLFSSDKELLQKCLNYIKEYMRRNGLTLNEKKTKLMPITQPLHFLGFSFLLKPNGIITMRVLKQKFNKNKRKLKTLVLKLGLSREQVNITFTCILAHMKKSNNRSQIMKMIHYYESLWKERNNELC